MSKFALLLGVWLAAFGATVVALVRSAPTEELRGRVVHVVDAGCDAIAVGSEGGFVVLRRIAGEAHPAVDDEIVGPLHLTGVRVFHVSGHGVLAAEVEGRTADSDAALRVLGETCGPQPIVRPVAARDLMN